MCHRVLPFASLGPFLAMTSEYPGISRFPDEQPIETGLPKRLKYALPFELDSALVESFLRASRMAAIYLGFNVKHFRLDPIGHSDNLKSFPTRKPVAIGPCNVTFVADISHHCGRASCSRTTVFVSPGFTTTPGLMETLIKARGDRARGSRCVLRTRRGWPEQTKDDRHGDGDGPADVSNNLRVKSSLRVIRSFMMFTILCLRSAPVTPETQASGDPTQNSQIFKMLSAYTWG